MSFNYKKLTVLLLLFVFVTIANVAMAAPVKMSMKDGYLLVLPEYDSNNVIVNFAGNFVNDTGADFNGEIWYYTPKDAQISMVCETENGMICVKYDASTVEGDYRIIKYKPTRTIKPGEQFPIMFEYTYNSFSQAGPREFPVKFKADSTIQNLTVEIKQPLRSTDFKMEPASQQTQQDAEGFTGHILQYPSLEEQKELKFTISYNKADNKPSIEAQENVAPQTSGQNKENNTMLIILFTVILAVLALVLVFALKNNRPQVPAKNKQSKKNNSSRPVQQVKAKAAPQKGKQPEEDYADERKKIRKLLIDGKISEQTYNQLMKELDS
ncbi:hypothetical protein [Zhaonella formicivorans]|jgi:hypothetical protein|uniref:hypothetical protein n=1 Tax=Zhaonella formicivorans TaxID=2528593 RepID=UPI0010E2EA93|nr:hypothetical protein [Zhaonella formicivorans]